MSTTLLTIVTLIYLAVAVNEVLRGSPAAAIVFGGYALANVGLIWGMQQ